MSAVNDGLVHISSLLVVKLLVSRYSGIRFLHLFYFYLYFKVLLLTSMLKFYSTESSSFSKIYIHKY